MVPEEALFPGSRPITNADLATLDDGSIIQATTEPDGTLRVGVLLHTATGESILVPLDTPIPLTRRGQKRSKR